MNSPRGQAAAVRRPGAGATRAARLLAPLLAALLVLGGCGRAQPARVVDPSGSSAETTQQEQPGRSPTGTAGDSGVELSRIDVSLTPRWEGLSEPLFLTSAPGDSSRIFIVEKTGRIRVVRDGRLLEQPYLDLSALVSSGGEQGLLGLAFSPRFIENGRLYVNYTDTSGDTNVVRYALADPSSDAPKVAARRRVLLVRQPYSNHNGGCIAFGPDGYLYVGMGDGGSGGDPEDRAQDPGVLLGKILRLDVGEAGDAAAEDMPGTYRIPDDNPFVGRTGYRGEIWALGARNPWRFSFDRVNGDLWIGDVGQSAWEEIDRLPAGKGGQNLGWNVFEGSHTYPPGRPAPADASRYTMPVAEYPQPTGASVTGGYVYRGSKNPVLQGVYLYGDFVTGRIWGLQLDGATETRELAKTELSIASFGEDADGELYVCDLRGTVYAISATQR